MTKNLKGKETIQVNEKYRRIILGRYCSECERYFEFGTKMKFVPDCTKYYNAICPNCDGITQIGLPPDRNLNSK